MRSPTIEWVGGTDGHVRLLDQTLLPREERVLEVRDERAMWDAIRRLAVRGAPAIGIAAAYGVVLGLRSATSLGRAAFDRRLAEVTDYLATSRPTAVNLFWALERMKRAAAGVAGMTTGETLDRLLAEARRIHEEDREACHAIGRHGAPLVPEGAGVLTHCNAGGLATAEYGTALAVLFEARSRGRRFHVFVDETRPLLQGARLTSWELMKGGVDCTLICDSMAGKVMEEGKVQLVVVGADRIAANGDFANKIGTYGLSVLARAHGIPFYVAAPSSTFDLGTPSGDAIRIEERPADEVAVPFGIRVAPEGVKVYNPAFDVTPAANVTAFVTELGVLRPPFEAAIAETIGAAARDRVSCS
ncbi:MAG: S-methyl-5-thioribose-1-phosphate isomerase [Planctomycetes bacterium]|nr:S-methyl-5-thioribose-1-phosphate isomerase [Planctomycetota bacterium]